MSTPIIQTDSTPDMIAWRIAKTTYVIMLAGDDGKPNLLVDPGLNKPWSTTNKKLADFHASQCNGEARTYEDALNILVKANPTFEKVLHENLAKKARILDAQQMKSNAAFINDYLRRGTDVKTPEVPKNDVNKINPEY